MVTGAALTEARASAWIALALVAALAAGGVVLRAANLGGPAFCCDEFYDVFAAKSWLAGEGLRVPGREYTRARLQVYLTAAAFSLFGEGEWQARLPALLFGVATLPLVYAVGRTLVGPIGAVVALGLLAVSPHAVDVSRFARLYSALTFFSLLAAFAAYRALEGRDARPGATRARAFWLLLAAGAGLAAAHLHPIALALGPAVLAYAALCAVGLAAAGRRGEASRYARGALALAAAGAALLLVPDVRSRVAAAALTPLPWYDPVPGDGWAYHEHLAAQYAWLWFLVWPATFVAMATRPRAGLFLACAFWLPLVLLSAVVATKHPRYAVHLLPLAWLLLGAAAEAAWPRLRAAVLGQATRLVRLRLDQRRGLSSLLVGGVAAAALLPVMRATPAVVQATRRPTQTTGHFTTGRYQEWRELAARLGPRIPPGARIVSTTWHAPIYYLHRPTNHLLPAFRERGEGDWETPERSAEAQVRTADDLARLLARANPVWVVARRTAWEREGRLDAGLTRFVRERCRREPLPPEASVVAFDCSVPSRAGPWPSPPGADQGARKVQRALQR